ncbi:MAG: DNA-directed RNA polymerase [Candidatus Diapherotrites archaeon]|nr:DNA-directed RNA polymerase [Candidatus Diapherotrites archaeon]
MEKRGGKNLFSIHTFNDTVRVAPNQLSNEMKKTVKKNLQKEYEGVLDEEIGVVVAITGVEKIGEGKIVPGDPGIYYSVDFNALTYKPEIQEVVEGMVSQITEFGAFVKIGPMEALTHVSQVMDDYINFDGKNQVLSGKESGKKLKTEDTVLARIVTVSLRGTVSGSKIGLTMRQFGLGKKEWKKLDEKTRDKKVKAPQKQEKIIGPKAPKESRGASRK